MEFKVDKELKLPELIFDARYHPTSETKLIAVSTIEGSVHLIESGSLKSKIKKHHKGSSIRKVRFFKDGRMVTIAKTVKVHDLTTNQTSYTLKRDDGKPTTFYSVMPFGSNILAAGDDDGGVFVYDLRSPDAPVFSSYDCDQYISDIDGKFESRRFMICTSGEGTLTAYDLRANKMIEPQSELFEAGFQCVKLVDSNKKVVIGGEDGAMYVFNHNEWAHTSGKFAIDSDIHNRGKCSIDCLDMLAEESTFLVGGSDGKVRSLTLWPHQIIAEKVLCKRSSIESIHVSPIGGHNEIVVSGGNYINIINYEEKEDLSDDETRSESNKTPSSAVSSTFSDEESSESENDSEKAAEKNQKQSKKFKPDDDDDYLKVFD